MTTTPEPLRPGYYVCTYPKHAPFVMELDRLGDWVDPRSDRTAADPRTLGYTIHYLPDLLAALAEVTRLRKRLAEEIHWGHLGCTPKNCTSSGIECPAATPQGEEGAG